MSKSINRVQLLGNVGKAPTIKTTNGGVRVATFDLATTESWREKGSEQWQERTQWHRVVVWSPVLVKRIEDQVTSGTPLLVEGKLETRSYEAEGQKRYVTEIVVRPYVGDMIVLNRRSSAEGTKQPQDGEEPPAPSAADYFQGAAARDELEDEIPF